MKFSKIGEVTSFSSFEAMSAKNLGKLGLS